MSEGSYNRDPREACPRFDRVYVRRACGRERNGTVLGVGFRSVQYTVLFSSSRALPCGQVEIERATSTVHAVHVE